MSTFFCCLSQTHMSQGVWASGRLGVFHSHCVTLSEDFCCCWVYNFSCLVSSLCCDAKKCLKHPSSKFPSSILRSQRNVPKRHLPLYHLEKRHWTRCVLSNISICHFYKLQKKTKKQQKTFSLIWRLAQGKEKLSEIMNKENWKIKNGNSLQVLPLRTFCIFKKISTFVTCASGNVSCPEAILLKLNWVDNRPFVFTFRLKVFIHKFLLCPNWFYKFSHGGTRFAWLFTQRRCVLFQMYHEKVLKYPKMYFVIFLGDFYESYSCKNTVKDSEIEKALWRFRSAELAVVARCPVSVNFNAKRWNSSTHSLSAFAVWNVPNQIHTNTQRERERERERESRKKLPSFNDESCERFRKLGCCSNFVCQLLCSTCKTRLCTLHVCGILHPIMVLARILCTNYCVVFLRDSILSVVRDRDDHACVCCALIWCMFDTQRFQPLGHKGSGSFFEKKESWSDKIKRSNSKIHPTTAKRTKRPTQCGNCALLAAWESCNVGPASLASWSQTIDSDLFWHLKWAWPEPKP